MRARSGPTVPPRPCTAWQLKHPLSKKTREPASTDWAASCSPCGQAGAGASAPAITSTSTLGDTRPPRTTEITRVHDIGLPSAGVHHFARVPPRRLGTRRNLSHASLWNAGALAHGTHIGISLLHAISVAVRSGRREPTGG